MENFEFKVDEQAPYIKAIRFLGTALLGFFIGAIVFTLKFEGTLEWMNLTGILLSLFFAFFPGKNKPSLTIDETGIRLHNYTFHWGEKNEIMWEKVKGIRVHNNVIEIKNSIGSTEKIQLPLHTKEQLEELESYLRGVTKIKELEYLND